MIASRLVVANGYFGIIGSDMFSTMSTGFDFDKLLPMLHLHFMTKILTSIGLDHEAVAEQARSSLSAAPTCSRKRCLWSRTAFASIYSTSGNW